jgi:cytochrome c5
MKLDISSLDLKLAALIAGSVLLVGCAGNPPKEQLAVAETVLRDAESADATRHAPVEMQKAREKYKDAEIAVHEESYEKAAWLAEQAEWDARVAERKARAAIAQQALQDAQRGVRELRQESLRSTQIQ